MDCGGLSFSGKKRGKGGGITPAGRRDRRYIVSFVYAHIMRLEWLH